MVAASLMGTFGGERVGQEEAKGYLESLDEK